MNKANVGVDLRYGVYYCSLLHLPDGSVAVMFFTPSNHPHCISATGSRFNGSSMVKVVPLPSWLSTAI